MKKLKHLVIIIFFVLLFTNCKNIESTNFIRPSDNPDFYNGDYIRSVKGLIKERYIERKLNESFTWKLKNYFSGKLNFSLYIESDSPPKNLYFSVTTNGHVLSEFTIVAGIFRYVRRINRYYGYKKFAIPIKIKKGTEIIFRIENKSTKLPGLKSDKGILYRLGDLHLKSDMHSGFEKILVISIDTLRADYVGVYQKLLGIREHQKSWSPNIDSVAAESVVFANAFTTNSATWPALSSLFLSSYPFQHGVLRNGHQLYDQKNTFSRLLFKEKFYNVSFRANAYSLDIGGFDKVRDFFQKDKRLISKALPLIEKYHNQKFFFWFHFMGVHAGYLPAKSILKKIEDPPYKGDIKPIGPVLRKITAGQKKVNVADINHIRNCYAAELMQLDRWLADIFELLKKKGIWDDTLIVITSDHGEDLYDHNNHFFHHPSIYNSSLHIPLIIKFPGSKFKKTINENVSILDIMPTVLDYFDIGIEFPIEGVSLLPLITGKDNFNPDRCIYAEVADSNILSVFQQNWKLIFNRNNYLPKTQYKNPYPIEKMELYNFRKDRNEKLNLSKNDQKATKLKSLLYNFLHSRLFFQRKKRVKNNKLNEKVRERLKTLGYL